MEILNRTNMRHKVRGYCACVWTLQMARRLRVSRVRVLLLLGLSLIGVYAGGNTLARLMQNYPLKHSGKTTYSLVKDDAIFLSKQFFNNVTFANPDWVRPVQNVSQYPNSTNKFEELDMNYLIPKDVFYFWCGPKRNFEFRHYLSVRSVFTYLMPYRVIFFYENEPVNEETSHDTWLQELREQNPYFSTNKLSPGWCNSIKQNMEKYLAEYGGIYVNEEVILVGSFVDERYRNYDRLTVMIDDGTKTNLLEMTSRQDKESSEKTNCINSRRAVRLVKSSWCLGDRENVRNQSGTFQMTTCNQPSRAAGEAAVSHPHSRGDKRLSREAALKVSLPFVSIFFIKKKSFILFYFFKKIFWN